MPRKQLENSLARREVSLVKAMIHQAGLTDRAIQAYFTPTDVSKTSTSDLWRLSYPPGLSLTLGIINVGSASAGRHT
jgi:hypothetical protein